MSDLTAKYEAPWWLPSRSSWVKPEHHVMVWCGEAHAHVDLGPMFWTDSPRRDFPHIVLGYQDEEPSQPEIHDADSLADWARLLAWLNAQPWPDWSLPGVEQR